MKVPREPEKVLCKMTFYCCVIYLLQANTLEPGDAHSTWTDLQHALVLRAAGRNVRKATSTSGITFKVIDIPCNNTSTQGISMRDFEPTFLCQPTFFAV